MTTVGQIYDFMDTLAPFSTAMDFDNVGLLVGKREAEVNQAILTLDITPNVVREAKRMGAQLIVSHHPVIFSPLKNLRPETAPYLLAEAGISAICAHTNLDMANGGVNTCLARRLGLTNVRPLKEYGNSGLAEALVGETEQEYSALEFALFVKDALGCDGLRYTDGGRAVRVVGVCSGGGADFLYDSAAYGAQAFVTGESKHHQLIDAQTMGITLVDAGHYYTEDVVTLPLLERLEREFTKVSFVKSKEMKSPAKYV